MIIEQLSDPTLIPKIAELFVMSVSKDYISHGEVIDGRAESFDEWRSDLLKVIKSEVRKGYKSKHSMVIVAHQKEKVYGFALIQIHRKKKINFAHH